MNNEIMKVTPEMVENTIADTVFFTAAKGVIGNDFQSTYYDFLIDSHTTEDDISDAAMLARDQASQALKTLSICVVTLKNGFTVVGTSTPVDPKVFDAEIGQRIARERAVEKIWPLLGYAMKEEETAKLTITCECLYDVHRFIFIKE